MSDAELVVVRTARSPFEAEVMAGILREAEIPVYVGSKMLNDEFALAQQLAGAARVELQVLPADLERAEAELAAAAEASALLDDEGFDPGEPVE